ncbi:hypothetical protein BDW60DRAFT_103776 [Aspergillus nidulans var. acristatus]
MHADCASIILQCALIGHEPSLSGAVSENLNICTVNQACCREIPEVKTAAVSEASKAVRHQSRAGEPRQFPFRGYPRAS